ncbi:MAG: DUF177 domain-containing protein [Nitrospirota bacterium]
MRIIVSSIPEDGLEEELQLPLSFGDISLKKDVRVLFRASKFGNKVLVTGKITSEAELVCSRCLNNFPYPLEINFNTEYVPYFKFTGEDAKRPEDEHELTKDELDVSFYQGDEINIEGLIKEHLILAVPMKPLCKSDCRGLCLKCGENLNEISCDCSFEEIDPRLEPLKKLKKNFQRG